MSYKIKKTYKKKKARINLTLFLLNIYIKAGT